MSQEQINRRDDLRRLVDDGYEVEIRAGHVIAARVPYVTSQGIVKYGRLVCPLSADGPPPDHTMFFEGGYRSRKTHQGLAGERSGHAEILV